MLLTGDLEAEGERLLIQRLKDEAYDREWGICPAIDYDVLKVAHHGSRNATLDELLQLTRPEISIVSCGKDNGYGHPHPELLERLKKIGSDIKITYESGAVTIKTDGVEMEILEYLSN